MEQGLLRDGDRSRKALKSEKEGERGVEDRRFGERTPLTRDWKVTRSCDCVWTVKFEGKEAKGGAISPWRAAPSSIYPICRVIVLAKIINRCVPIGMASSVAEPSTRRDR